MREPCVCVCVQPGSEGDHIVDVRVNKLYDVTTSSMDRDPGEWSNIALARRKNGPSRCLSCTAVFVDRQVCTRIVKFKNIMH